MEAVLEVKAVTKRYRSDRGIDRVSFTVYSGDIFGLFGPNGAGKTTLIKSITGLCRADAGQIAIFGHSLTEQFEQAMEHVGCIVETGISHDYLTPYQNLQLVARYYPEVTRERIDEVLELVGLSAHKHEKVKGFSSGMKQRAALAAVLLPKPRLVILDEPTTSLDIEGVRDFRLIVNRLAQEEQTTFLISSHSIHEMERMCNRIGIMYGGVMVKEGLVSDLLSDGQTLEDVYLSQIDQAKGA
ncbi:ABC transporter ATP-binding protein [Brevibacillus fluminis]|uniref:ABC transporter ATP-binding protein n=1 Tax=Brevibacillus fluminis TaxID=511487 RepID=A0A3M8DVA9_9BACL|nr:ABC transporter ATP-binding protein [Brevibacillus fluminis]RNB91415.1 ABC transporter ATP-binding protein [Brevibacillus fluminis]